MYSSTQSQHQMEVSGQINAPPDYSGTHCIAGWVGPRAGPDVLENRQIAYLKLHF